jgi:nucleotidyltransferase-like protein
MFSMPPSITHDLSLEDVLEQLKQHDLVEGLLITGSGGRSTLKPESDYDIVIVLREYPLPLHIILTTIDGRMTDIAFWHTERLDEMLVMDTVKGNSAEGVVFTWLRDGQIVYDPTGKLAQVKAHSVSFSVGDDARENFNLWFRINFNLYHGRRMLQSQDEIYLLAMDFRFLYMLVEVMYAYLSIRGIPQRGEKNFIDYLKQRDSEALDLYYRAVHATNRQEKFAHYVEFATLALEPVGGLWGTDAVTAFNLDCESSLEDRDKLFDFWRDLLSQS